MSRRGQTFKRKTESDPLYEDRLIAKLINQSMRSGKKTVAGKQVYNSLEIIRNKQEQDPLVIFHQALENIKPQMEVRPRRIGGAAYQVPAPVRGTRRESLAIRWLVQVAREKPNKEYHTFAEKLAAEILDAYKNTGGAVRKKENVHRMAEANRAFAHFRW